MDNLIGIKGAIFDMDGTLLDSMPIWNSIVSDYLRSIGKTPKPGLLDELLALGGHEIPSYLKAEYEIEKAVQEIQESLYQMLSEFYFYRAPLKPGAMSVLEKLRDRGVKMCLATATDRWLVEPALRRCGIFDFFSRIFTCGEENASKSTPEIFVRAAAFLQTNAKATLVVEDAPYAVRSAKEAGLIVAGVYDPAAHDQQDDIKQSSDYYFESLDEMLKLL